MDAFLGQKATVLGDDLDGSLQLLERFQHAAQVDPDDGGAAKVGKTAQLVQGEF